MSVLLFFLFSKRKTTVMIAAMQTTGMLTPRPILREVFEDCEAGNGLGELVLAAPTKTVDDGL